MLLLCAHYGQECIYLLIDIIRYSFVFIIILQAAGKYRQQGRNYIVEDGDIIFFKFNAPNAPKKK